MNNSKEKTNQEIQGTTILQTALCTCNEVHLGAPAVQVFMHISISVPGYSFSIFMNVCFANCSVVVVVFCGNRVFMLNLELCIAQWG